jgi:hypothetical protein
MPDKEEGEKELEEVPPFPDAVKYEINGVYWVNLPGVPSWPCRIISGDELTDKPSLADGEVSNRL